MILNMIAGWHTIVWTLTLLHAASVSVTVSVEGLDCYDSGQNHANTDVYTPSHCRPTDCTVTTSLKNKSSIEGLQCSIKNYVNHFPNACKEIKEHIGQQGELSALQEAVQTTLASINLYMLHCKVLESPSVSLNFTFNFPLFGESETQKAPARSVMVEFSAGKEDVENYYALNPICRVFDITGSDFSHLTQEEQSQILVSYDCIGVGLKDEDHRLNYYYYLSLTTFPAGQVVKYSLVYRNGNSTSMQLAAAAWLSTSRVHVVFQPISNVTTYHVAAECLQKKIYIVEVSSSSSVEIPNIPPECIIARIFVTPLATECKEKGLACSPAILTLDKTGLHLPGEPKQEQGFEWLWLIGIIIVVVIVSLIIVAILVLLRRRLTKPTENGNPVAEGPELRVVCIASPSVASQNLHTNLKNHGFHVTDAVQDNIGSMMAMRNSHAILVSVHPSLTEANQFAVVLELLKQVFTNQQLWERVRVASYSSRGQGHPRPSDIFQGMLNNPKEADFLQLLDQRTFNLPEDREDLVEDLRCLVVSPTERGDSRMAGGLGGLGVSSHQNGGVNGMPARALGHVEVLSHHNGGVPARPLGHVEVLSHQSGGVPARPLGHAEVLSHHNGGVNGTIARNARRQYPAHSQEEAEGLIAEGQEDDVVWVPHDPECQVLFHPDNHTRGATRHGRMCPGVLYHHHQGAELPEHADKDQPSLVDPRNVSLYQRIRYHNLQGAAELPAGDHPVYSVSQPVPVDPMHVRAYQGYCAMIFKEHRRQHMLKKIALFIK